VVKLPGTALHAVISDIWLILLKKEHHTFKNAEPNSITTPAHLQGHTRIMKDESKVKKAPTADCQVIKFFAKQIYFFKRSCIVAD